MSEDDRAWADYGERFRTEVFPKLLESAIIVHIATARAGEMPDIQQATELGMALLLGKPLLLLKTPGAKVPKALARLAHGGRAHKWDPRDHASQERLAELIKKLASE